MIYPFNRQTYELADLDVVKTKNLFGQTNVMATQRFCQLRICWSTISVSEVESN